AWGGRALRPRRPGDAPGRQRPGVQAPRTAQPRRPPLPYGIRPEPGPAVAREAHRHADPVRPPGRPGHPGHRRTAPPRAGGRATRLAGTGANRPGPAVARADPRPARFGRRTGAPANRRPRASPVVQTALPAPVLTGPDRRGEASGG